MGSWELSAVESLECRGVHKVQGLRGVRGFELEGLRHVRDPTHAAAEYDGCCWCLCVRATLVAEGSDFVRYLELSLGLIVTARENTYQEPNLSFVSQ